MITSGWDDSTEVAWRLVEGMRAEFEYESDRKKAVADMARALQDAYKVGMDEAMRQQVPERRHEL